MGERLDVGIVFSVVMGDFPPSACCDADSRLCRDTRAALRENEHCTHWSNLQSSVATTCIANSHRPQAGFNKINVESQGMAGSIFNECFLGFEFCHFVET